MKKIVFLTGTRADFGKLKPLIEIVEESKQYDNYVFVTGMHTLSRYGSTYDEVLKQKYRNVFVFMNQTLISDMDAILANTIMGFGNFIKEIRPDLIVVHGDRVEAMAGAIVGSLNNILVAHIEGGELSGTIDGLIRHSITKMSHLHFVSNKASKDRLLRMGEEEKSVFVIGSPDIDIMLSDRLPTLEDAKNHYEIPFKEYAILAYHPVTTHTYSLKEEIRIVLQAITKSERDYIVIFPNNDSGSDIILNEILNLKGNTHFRIFPSIRFEYFLTLLKHCDFIIGNSSAGIREAEVFGIPSINVGDRQMNRSKSDNILNVEPTFESITKAIDQIEDFVVCPSQDFGRGNSRNQFFDILAREETWNTSVQKTFQDCL